MRLVHLFVSLLAVGRRPLKWLIDGNNLMGHRSSPITREAVSEKLRPMKDNNLDVVLIFDSRKGEGDDTKVTKDGKFSTVIMGEGKTADDYILGEIESFKTLGSSFVQVVTADRDLRRKALETRSVVRRVINPAVFWRRYRPRLTGLKKFDQIAIDAVESAVVEELVAAAVAEEALEEETETLEEEALLEVEMDASTTAAVVETNTSPVAVGQTTVIPRDTTYELHHVMSPDDFLELLAKDERLVVIKVGASWCNVCKAFDVRWRKLVNNLSDKLAGGQVVERGRARFAEIEFTENEDLCRGLQATKLPHVLVFRGATGPAGLLENFQCGPAAFQKVIDIVNLHLDSEVVRNPDFGPADSQ
jgi:thiol-disulfide isomerase/thioredoxin